MDNNEKHTKTTTSKLKRYGLTILSLFAGLILAGGVIHYSGDMSQQLLAHSQTAPFAYLLNQNQQSGPGGSCGTTGIAGSPSSAQAQCLAKKRPDMCLANSKELCDADREIARIAWKYFEKNYNPETGLYNATNNFRSTTMWDTGSALAATIAARDFGFIDKKDFDDRIMAMFKTLNTMKLFNDEAPNKVYNTKTGAMVDYANKAKPDGIGVSILDLGRLASWLNTLQCMHPRYKTYSKKALERWKYDRLLKDGQMYGLARDEVSKEIKVLQEGRLGYEQYAAKVFRNLGFDMHVAATYNNKFRRDLDIMDVSIAYDKRDPREFGANNYVITESYSMDAQENSIDSENRPLIQNIFNVQQERWKRTGIVTAVSEDNIDRKPWFIYNTILNAGIQWSTINPRGDQFPQYKTVSTKAALSLAVLYPEEEYSQVLLDTIENAYNEDSGWYSGVYEGGLGYNKALTANTNGNIMANMLYKKHGSFYELCSGCKRMIELDSKLIVANRNLPCGTCGISTLKTAKDNAVEEYARKDTD
ncbi:MAG: DUF3131 domain-containing protein [Thiolinea sp.]